MTTRFDVTIRQINLHARRSHVDCTSARSVGQSTGTVTHFRWSGINFCVDFWPGIDFCVDFCFDFLNNCKFCSRSSRRSAATTRKSFAHYLPESHEPSRTQLCGNPVRCLLARCSSFVCLDTYMKRRVYCMGTDIQPVSSKRVPYPPVALRRDICS